MRTTETRGADKMFKKTLDSAAQLFDSVLAESKTTITTGEVGTVTFIGNGIARVNGLPTIRSEELIQFPGGVFGLAFNIDIDEVGVVMLGESDHISAGARAYRTGRVVDIPVGESLLGRTVSAVGEPLDNLGPLSAYERWPVEREAPSIMKRDPVSKPLETGVKVIDALVPVGHGQRELILGDRQTGKTAIALDTIINQKNKDVVCVYCAIGQRGTAVAKFMADLRHHGSLSYCVIVAAGGDEPPGLQYIAPYAATSVAEYFMEKGREVLIIYDDLTKHARAYRELSLLLKRPPGREAYPGDIFYIHSRLLERSTHLRAEYGGGSLTALPILETQSQNISAYIPTNLISITDGQVYLSPDLFQKGVLPAVDVGKSVSRVGGKTQLPAYRDITGHLRLSYSQFEELEAFSRFGTRLDKETIKTIERGRRVREALKQPQYLPIPLPEQIMVVLAVINGVFDGISLEKIPAAEERVRSASRDKHPELLARIESGAKLTDEEINRLLDVFRQTLRDLEEA